MKRKAAIPRIAPMVKKSSSSMLKVSIVVFRLEIKDCGKENNERIDSGKGHESSDNSAKPFEWFTHTATPVPSLQPR